jgi:hypothetical protein
MELPTSGPPGAPRRVAIDSDQDDKQPETGGRGAAPCGISMTSPNGHHSASPTRAEPSLNNNDNAETPAGSHVATRCASKRCLLSELCIQCPDMQASTLQHRPLPLSAARPQINLHPRTRPLQVLIADDEPMAAVRWASTTSSFGTRDAVLPG